MNCNKISRFIILIEFVLTLLSCKLEVLDQDETLPNPNVQADNPYQNRQSQNDNTHDYEIDDNKDSSSNQSSKKIQIASMLVLGDSISAGFASDTQLGTTIPLNSPLLNLATDLLLKGSNIEEAFLSLNNKYKHNYQLAFTGSGHDCFSHQCRLGLSNSKNEAVLGHTIEDVITTQIPAIKSQFDYIILEIGHNDICQETFDLQQFASDVSKALELLKDQFNPKLINVIPILDISQVYSLFPPDANALSIESLFGTQDISCGEIRDGYLSGGDFVMCPIAAFDNHVDTLKKRREKTNASILNEIKELDPDGELIVFSDKVSDAPLTRNHLASDCFHPSEFGHREISRLSWLTIQDRIDL